MKELYEARNKLEIVRIRKKSIVETDAERLNVIDALNGMLFENEQLYNSLKNDESALSQKIKILELVYFCQNGSYPDETNN